MKQVRVGVFETNSSSTHSLTLCAKEDFEKWKKGNCWLEGNKILFQADIDKLIEGWKGEYPDVEFDEDTVAEFMADYGIKTYASWVDEEHEETFMREYTTKGGEVIVAFGSYGYC